MQNKKIRRKVRPFIILLILSGAFFLYFMLVAVDHPPVVGDKSALNTQREQIGENTFIFGENWLRKSESGLWEMYIEGDAFNRGVAFGALTQELLYYQEKVFIDQIRELVPSDSYLKILKYFIALFNRNLDKNITEELKQEIYGTSLFCSPEFDFIGSGYQRQLNYHAAHDIGHALKGLNMVGCTSFACWDDETTDSSLITARNFDFYAGKKFSDNKIVCFVNPTEGYKFMMITWAAMSGVVSGMNEKGLTVTLNAAKSAVPSRSSTPVALLAREILQYASTIGEAYEISKKRKLFVSESILVSSDSDGKAVIIEKSPKKTGLFRSGSNRVICSNHFQSETFALDKINLKNIRESDSEYRFKRVEELLDRLGKIDVEDAASVLRNRMGLGETDPGMGNQLAINQLIAHHAVIFKPKQQLVWVSSPPYQLGRFTAYDLNRVFALSFAEIRPDKEIYNNGLTIKADTFLFSDEYLSYTRYLSLTDSINRFKRNGMALPDSFEIRYTGTNPQLYLTYSNLGNYYRKMKKYETASIFYEKALEKEIPGTAERYELEKTLEKILKKTR
jgi:tetratricopeptide (TPR) repeat protein